MAVQQWKDNPFFDATKEVFQSMLDMEISPLPENGGAGGEESVKVEIALVGDLSGTVVYNFPKSTTLNIVKVLSGMDADQLDEFATSMLGEMANIISGNAVTALSGQNYQCDIKPPQITVGSADSGKYCDSVDLQLRAPVGEMCEHIRLSSKS